MHQVCSMIRMLTSPAWIVLQIQVQSADRILELLNLGNSRRKTESTEANVTSSRLVEFLACYEHTPKDCSHCMFLQMLSNWMFLINMCLEKFSLNYQFSWPLKYVIRILSYILWLHYLGKKFDLSYFLQCHLWNFFNQVIFYWAMKFNRWNEVFFFIINKY